jgi:hypothetical protein
MSNQKYIYLLNPLKLCPFVSQFLLDVRERGKKLDSGKKVVVL